ncbi:MAG: hypothetical protein QM778_28705 [Myxococcales bacterium]
MKRAQRHLAMLTSCALLMQACGAFSRSYVVETPRAAPVDEAFYLNGSTIQVDDLGYCLRIPLDLGVSLAGLEHRPQAFDYVVAALDQKGQARSDVSTRYRIFARDRKLELSCADLNYNENQRGSEEELGSFLLSQQGGAPHEKSLARTFKYQDYAKQPLTIGDDDWQRGFVSVSNVDLVVRFESDKARYALKPGEQVRMVLKLENQAKENLPGTTEVELQKVRKPRGWLALVIGLTLLGAGTVLILHTTDQ